MFIVKKKNDKKRMGAFLRAMQETFGEPYFPSKDPAIAVARQELENDVVYGNTSIEDGFRILGDSEALNGLFKDAQRALEDLAERRVKESEDQRIKNIEKNTSPEVTERSNLRVGYKVSVYTLIPVVLATYILTKGLDRLLNNETVSANPSTYTTHAPAIDKGPAQTIYNNCTFNYYNAPSREDVKMGQVRHHIVEPRH